MKYRIKAALPLHFTAVVLFSLLVAACSHTVRVEGKYPSPVGEQLPLSVGIYLSDDFRNYIYEEDSEDREEWKINTGRAQKNLFETVLGSMFTNTVSFPSTHKKYLTMSSW
ncbi:hypothetical protein P3339_19810 [Microbulbifer sp. MLAF003]|uniref:hypothetical protein n=1 Tax=Microbulbifer sp. MLAF003 TaxID=3032582 RepID=UPI0024AE747B|nr:hypothetical protein [Microbulbifer sp. MLAF003]WHI50653.1 hypothetical protein P3339_19810 [Microbulbifer sp. MLAF003]